MGDAPAAHREAVADLMRRASFDDVEEFIDSLADVSDDGKSALWLYAWSLQDQGVQRREALVCLEVVDA